jgi:hypothetical protein
LRDPFAPEKGEAKVIRRVVRNVSQLPVNLGESVSINRGYWEKHLQYPSSVIRITPSATSWLIFVILYMVGLTIIAGLVLQLLQRKVTIPLYVFIYSSAICLTPFPEQYSRYLMPIAPFLILSFIVFLLTVKRAAIRILSSKWSSLNNYLVIAPILFALLFQLITFQDVYFNELEPIEYFDRNSKFIKHRMFFENDSFQAFNLCINYVSQNAQPSDVIAAGTPHWIYLRTGLKAVMPPFENNPARVQQQLDSVPVTYLITGKDVIGSERYTLPVVEQFTEQWKQVFTAPESDWAVYQRINR